MTKLRSAKVLCLALVVLISSLTPILSNVHCTSKNEESVDASPELLSVSQTTRNCSFPPNAVANAKTVGATAQANHTILVSEEYTSSSESFNSAFFSDFKSLLLSKGYDVNVGNSTLSLNMLSGINVLVLSMPRAQYTVSETNTIEQFVSSGGGLFCIADNSDVWRVDNVIETWGFHQASGVVNDSAHCIDSPSWVYYEESRGSFGDHPITSGLTMVQSAAANWLLKPLPNGATSIITTDVGGAASPAGVSVYAALENGSGRIVISMDSNFFTSSAPGGKIGLGVDDDARLGLNTIAWLMHSPVPDYDPPVVQNVGHEPLYPDQTDEITFQANVTDNVQVDKVFLNYTVDMGKTWSLKPMIIVVGTEYSVSLGPYASDTILGYNVVANDTSNNWGIGWETYVPAASAPPYTPVVVSTQGQSPEPPYVPGDNESAAVPYAQTQGCVYIFPNSYQTSIIVDVGQLGIWVSTGTYFLSYTSDGGTNWTNDTLENVFGNVWEAILNLTGASIMFKVESIDPYNNVLATRIYWIIIGYHTPFLVFVSLYPVGHVLEEVDETMTPCDVVPVYFYLRARNLVGQMNETTVNIAPAEGSLIKSFGVTSKVLGTINNDSEVTFDNNMTIHGSENPDIAHLISNPGEKEWLTNQIQLGISYTVNGSPGSDTINATPVDLTGQPLYVVYRLMGGDDDHDGIPNYLEDFRICTKASFDVSLPSFGETLRFAGNVYSTQLENGSAKLSQVLELFEHGATARKNLADYDHVGLLVIDLYASPFTESADSGFIRALLLSGLILSPAVDLFAGIFQLLKCQDGHLRLAFVVYSKDGSDASSDVDFYYAKENLAMPEGFEFVFTQVSQERVMILAKAIVGILVGVLAATVAGVPVAAGFGLAVVVAVADFVTDVGVDVAVRETSSWSQLLDNVKYVKLIVESAVSWKTDAQLLQKVIDIGGGLVSTLSDPGLRVDNGTGQLALGIDYTTNTTVNSAGFGLYLGAQNSTCGLMFLSKDSGPYNVTVVAPTADQTFYRLQMDDPAENSSYVMGGYVANSSSSWGQLTFSGNTTRIDMLQIGANAPALTVESGSKMEVNVTVTDQDLVPVSGANVTAEFFNATYVEAFDAADFNLGNYSLSMNISQFSGICYVRITASEAGYFPATALYQVNVIPEFSSMLILLVFMMATLLAVVIYEKKRRRFQGLHGSL